MMESSERADAQIHEDSPHPAFTPYLYAIIALGMTAIAVSLYKLPGSGIGYQWIILALLTIITSAYYIKIPSINAKISVGDTLFFTNVILFGTPAGIITAALDVLAGSIRSRARNRRLQYVLFNTSAIACSAYVAGSLFFKISRTGPLLHESHASFSNMLIPLGVLAFVHYLANSGSVAIIVALEKRRNIFLTWKEGFLWTSITYFAGAAAAGFIAIVIGPKTPQILGVTMPVLVAIYFTYKTYLEKVEQARSLAHYDSLTGLPNRNLFKEKLEESLKLSEAQRHLLAVMFLDLDHFKRINDTYGHGIGDLLLKTVAARLAAGVRTNESNRNSDLQGEDIVIGRFGGDEFTILIKEITNPKDATRIAQRLLQTMSNPYALDGLELDVAATIGISIYPFDGRDSDTLLRNADTALYHAKENGRNSFHLYSQSMNEKAFEKLSMGSQLRKALHRKEFEIHYQPKLAAQTREIAGAEALIRWRHPVRGLLQASEFIPLAEETGLIKPIGEWVLRTVCAQISIWLKEGLPVVPVAVNLSPLQFGQGNLASLIARILAETSLDQRYLELELTESAIMENQQEADDSLAELRLLGMNISIDDFGTGYSSLSRLKSFNLDALKIDKSFVLNCSENPDDRAIITAIVAMARSLELKVVAEGVETEQQLAFLRELGCDEIQGYYFSKPIPPQEFASLLQNSIDPLPKAINEASVSFRLVKGNGPSEDRVAGAAG
jgi:diguanylate cyclase (GGDEF)-like protein